MGAHGTGYAATTHNSNLVEADTILRFALCNPWSPSHPWCVFHRQGAPRLRRAPSRRHHRGKRRQTLLWKLDGKFADDRGAPPARTSSGAEACILAPSGGRPLRCRCKELLPPTPGKGAGARARAERLAILRSANRARNLQCVVPMAPNVRGRALSSKTHIHRHA